MRSFFRNLLRSRSSCPRPSSPQIRTMSGIPTAGLLYACTMSPPSASGAVPEDSKELAHHLKNGKGFWNPWDSAQFLSAPQMFTTMFKFATLSLHLGEICADIRAIRFMVVKQGYRKFPDVTPPTVPVVMPSFLETRTSSTALRATWLGHACYYVEFPTGLRVLCRPFYFLCGCDR